MDLCEKLSMDELKLGGHLCCVYETEEEHKAFLTPFLRDGLNRNEKVVYIVDTGTPEMILDYLRKDGLTVESFIKSGQLRILSTNETYLRSGSFDPDNMIRFLESQIRQALEEGYSGLRTTGEMTWVLKSLPGSERFIEYEVKLNDFIPESKCLAVCQYDRRRFTPDVLLQVMNTHPVAAIGTELFDNFYFIPVKDFFVPDKDQKVFNQWLKHLSVYKKMLEDFIDANQQLKASEQQLKAANQQLRAGEQQLRASNEQLRASEQQLRAVNQQLRANEQQLRAEIAQRKKIEESLRESQQKIRAVFDQTYQFIGMMTVDGILIEANRSALEFSGIAEKDVLGKPFWETPWWTHSSELQEKLRQAVKDVAGGVMVRFEATHLAQDGSLHYIDFSLKPIKGEEGEVKWLIPEGRDITERKKIEEEAQERLRKLEIFYKASMDREERIIELKREIESLKNNLKK